MDQALSELRRGHKDSHWMWFIFPQIEGLGQSEMSRRYAIASLEEARAYLAHPILGERLREFTETALHSPAASAEDVFGPIDSRKLRSSMTLFHQADPSQPLFQEVLARWFGGVADQETDRLLEEQETR